MINYETSNYESANASYFKEARGNCRNASCGTVIRESVSTVTVIGNKNGIKLIEVTVTSSTHWELFMDGELLNKFYNARTAKAMFKDFSA